MATFPPPGKITIFFALIGLFYLQFRAIFDIIDTVGSGMPPKRIHFTHEKYSRKEKLEMTKIKMFPARKTTSAEKAKGKSAHTFDSGK